MDALNRIPQRQIDYAFESYGNDELDLNKLLQKLIAVYTLGSGGYWEAMFDTIQSTVLVEHDEAVAIELYDHDASSIAGIMSCMPAVILMLTKMSGLGLKDLKITEEDALFLNKLDEMRGENKLHALLDTSGAKELLGIDPV